MTDVIDSFSGPYRFLSNFHPSPIRWRFATVTFPTVEHGFVWHKTRDEELRNKILTIDTPGKVKRFGRNLTLRNDWEDIKLGVMRELVVEKFIQNPDLRGELLATGNATLIEGNHWGDKFWGVCDGEGENHLGLILMNTRRIIREIV